MKRLLLVLIIFFAFSGMALAAVNLNSASLTELQAVNGIGPKKAEAIVEYRKKNGPFKTVDDLKKVSGFGDKSLEKMRSELTVDGAAPTKAEKKAEAKKDKQEAQKGDKKDEKKAKKEAKQEAKKDKKEAKKEDSPAKK